MKSRVVFLDYDQDGVVNTPMWNEKGTKCTYNFPSDNKVNNFQAVQWLSEACQKFHYDIVVTSTWRWDRNYKECLINGGLREGIEILGRTPELRDQPRGAEIKKYIEEHTEIKYYVIIDDDSDMLPEQMDHFINTDTVVGFTLNEFSKFEKIFMSDKGRGGSFIENETRKDTE